MVRLKRVVLGPAVFAAASLLAREAAAQADVTRVLEASLPAAPGAAFAVENLAGTLTVVRALGPSVRVKATVHAETDAMADSLSIVTVPGKDGTPTLHVRYPVDRHHELRYPARGADGSSDIDYGGHRVRVSGHRGILLFADLVVEVPAGMGQGRIETRIGAIDAERLDGTLRLETGRGPVRVSRSKGDLVADSGSGDVEARDVHGSYRCDSGNGDCRVEDFEGGRLACETGSGAVVVTRARAQVINVDTGSGQVRLTAIDAEEVQADTGSGAVELEAFGDRLRRVAVDTGSGTVRLRLPRGAGFDAKANLGGGDLRCDYEDAERVVRRAEVVGCRRGDRRIEIKVETGSGGLLIEPTR